MKHIGVWFPAIRAGTGVDIYTEILVEALRKKGIRAEIAWLPSRAEYLPWSVRVPKPPKWATVVHVNSWLHQRFLPAELPLITTFHSCVHDPSLSKYKNNYQKLYHRFWVKKRESQLLKRSRFITTVSNYTAKKIRQVFGIQNVHVIYNWVNTKIFYPRSGLKDSTRPFRLIFSGNLKLMKGADLLIPIMESLGQEFELYYTGSSSELHNTPPSNMISVGWSENALELAKIYRKADALLFPTRLEGFGLVALEAQACGIPVIATNGSSLPEVVENGVTGILCKLDSINEYVQAARLLRDDQRKYNEMSLKSREMVLNKFDPEILVSKYIKLYQKA